MAMFNVVQTHLGAAFASLVPQSSNHLITARNILIHNVNKYHCFNAKENQ
eukprot:m.339942 g.339942  ORF g.339942 m.339942 type:complete len:50 (-) comp19043_c0_seq1:1049-1198(-)